MSAAAKSLQSFPTLCDPIDGGPPGSPIPGILQARTLEWVAISFSNAWKGKVKVKWLSRVRLFTTLWSAAFQAPLSMGFSRQEYWRGCHCLQKNKTSIGEVLDFCLSFRIKFLIVLFIASIFLLVLNLLIYCFLNRAVLKSLTMMIRASLVAQMVKNLPSTWETWVQSLVWVDPLERGTATLRILWTV